MTSAHRPPLNLTDPEPGLGPVVQDHNFAPSEAMSSVTGQDDDLAMPTSETSEASSAERPMSERQRRRLLEEQRLAEERAAIVSAPTPEISPFATSAEAPPATTNQNRLPAPAVTVTKAETKSGTAYLIAGIASALWIGGVASWFAYEFGYGSIDLDPLRIAVYAMIALAPAGLAIIMAHTVRQGAKLASETRRARDMAESLIAPTALAAQQTGQVLNTLRSDIDQAALAAERARNDMTLLRQALVEETARLNEAAELASHTARNLSEQMAQDRERMGALGTHLDGQANSVLQAVERQSRMVVDASDLAQTQLREAEAALAARAADLAAAASEAQEASRLASDGLAQQTVRLETAGTGVAEQIHTVSESLSQQRGALVSAAFALRTDQEDFAAQIESQRAQFTQQLALTRAAANDLDQLTGTAGSSMKTHIDAAASQFRTLVELAQREADGFDNATKLALDRFEAVAAEARDVLVEETRRALAALQATADDQRTAADAALEQAKIRADRLAEALFDAAQKADGAAEARIDDARRIVNKTAEMVDLTGERMIERLEDTMSRMTSALNQVETAVAELDSRTARLPEEASARVETVRQAVEQGLAALNDASRRAAADTEALDASFQERVRRNYEMLSEAVRMAGVVTGDNSLRRREPLLGQREARAAAAPPPVQAPPPQPFAPRTSEPVSYEPTAQEPELNWRSLSPQAQNLHTQAPVQTQRVEPPVEEAPQAPLDAVSADELASRMTTAIRRMGVDPNALLPRPRIEEAARALAMHEPVRARQIVRRVAPAAVRSVSRRVMSDADLRQDSEVYVRLMSRALSEQARQGDVIDIQSRLATDEGRAFMLLDAAIGDIT